MKQLHPNSIVIFYINGLIASIFLLGFLVFPWPLIVLITLAVEGTIGFVWNILFLIFATAVTFLIPLPWALLSYQNFRYQITEDTIVIEKGVVWKRHVSIPVQRIQNIDVVRGPIARILGLSDLQIQTAGMSGVAIVEGRILAIEPNEAIKLKDEILSKVTKVKNQDV